MKQFVLITLAAFCIALTADAQQKVKEKDLIGTWEMVIVDLEDKKDEYSANNSDDNDRGDASDRFESAIESAVEGFVSDLLGDMSFIFTFKENKTVRMDISVMGITEIEHVDWYINDDGALVLEDDDDDDDNHFDTDDVWMMKNGRLVQVEADGDINEDVYMKRVD